MNEKDIVQFTEYMNSKALKDKIKFALEHSETDLVFLDTKVHFKNGFLIPVIYSKSTDSHEYLKPKSSHPPNVAKKHSTFSGLRVRRNCSDRIEGDTLFKKSVGSEYIPSMGARDIDRSFIKVANRKEIQP